MNIRLGSSRSTSSPQNAEAGEWGAAGGRRSAGPHRGPPARRWGLPEPGRPAGRSPPGAAVRGFAGLQGLSPAPCCLGPDGTGRLEWSAPGSCARCREGAAGSPLGSHISGCWSGSDRRAAGRTEAPRVGWGSPRRPAPGRGHGAPDLSAPGIKRWIAPSCVALPC